MQKEYIEKFKLKNKTTKTKQHSTSKVMTV